MSYTITIENEEGETIARIPFTEEATIKLLAGAIAPAEDQIVNVGRPAKKVKKVAGGGQTSKGKRLTELDHMDIKEKLADGQKVKDIAEEYGVNPVTIYALKKKFANDLA